MVAPVRQARDIARCYPGLYQHQLEGIEFLLARDRAILADSMGLGKSRQAIVAAIERGGNVLTICPASLKFNWRREIEVVDPLAGVFIVDGSAYEPGHRWTVINYDILGRHREVLSQTAWRTIILDEVHLIKNDSQRTRHVLGHRGQPGVLARAEGVYLLTGTPITSRPKDLFNLLKAVKHPLGQNFFKYGVRFCNGRRTNFGWDWSGASNLEELATLIAPVFLQRKKEDVLDLPEKIRTYMPVAIPRREYDRAEARFLASRSLAELMVAKHLVAQAKIGAACEHIDSVLESGEKLLVFSSYNAVVDAVMVRYRGRAVKLTGEDSQKARDTAVQRFQTDSAVRIFVGNMKAAGLGLNLTAASNVLFADLDWVPATHWQAEDRAHRIGTKHSVNIVYLVAQDSIDDYIQEVLEGKTQIVGTIEKAAARWLEARRRAKLQRRKRERKVYAPDEF